MTDILYGPLVRIVIDAIPISIVGWIGIWLLSCSVERVEWYRSFGGPYTLLVVWGLAIVADFQTNGRSVPVIHTFYFALLALGLLATVVYAIVGIFRRLHHRH
jgi:hypothetical protein